MSVFKIEVRRYDWSLTLWLKLFMFSDLCTVNRQYIYKYVMCVKMRSNLLFKYISKVTCNLWCEHNVIEQIN